MISFAPPMRSALRAAALALAVFLLTAPAPRVLAADASRTLRVAFPVAETGFDPQAIGDTYSDAVCLAIFGSAILMLLVDFTHDVFARIPENVR